MRAVVLVPLRAEERRARPVAANGKHPTANPAPRSPEDRLEEAVGLARAIDLEVRTAEIVPLARPQPSTLIGSGKVEEVAALVAE
jgi:GTPase